MPDDAQDQRQGSGEASEEGQRSSSATATQRTDAQGDQGDDGDDFDADRARRTIEAQRASERRLQKELDAARRALKERDDAKLSETERLTKRVAELEQAHTAAQRELVQERQRNAVLGAAGRLGAKDGTLVYRLVRDDLDADETDARAIEAAVKGLLKEHPYLVNGTGSADGGAGQGGRTGGGLDMNTQIRRAMGRA